MRGVETEDAHTSVEGPGDEINQLLAGLERLRPEIGPLAEELIELLRGNEATPSAASAGLEKD